MKPYLTACGLAALLATTAPAGQALAQEGGSFSLTPYLWVVGLKGDVGARPGRPPVNVDADFGGIVDHIDGALMLKAEGTYGRFGAFADVDYLRLGAGRDVHFNDMLDLGGDVELKVLGGTVAGFYRFGQPDVLSVDLLAGARLTSLGVEASGHVNNVSFSGEQSNDWWDPVIGARAIVAMSDRWTLTAYGDYGGFGVSSDAVAQVYGTVNFAMSDHFVLSGGYRYYRVDFADHSLDYNVQMAGPVFGLTYRF